MAQGTTERTSERVKVMKENFIDLHNEGLSISEIAARFKLSGSTVYRYLDEIAKENGTSREDLLQKSLYHTQAERLRREEKEAKASFEKVQKELAVLQNSLQIVRSLVDNVKESIMTYEKIEQEEYEDAKNLKKYDICRCTHFSEERKKH